LDEELSSLSAAYMTNRFYAFVVGDVEKRVKGGGFRESCAQESKSNGQVRHGRRRSFHDDQGNAQRGGRIDKDDTTPESK